MTPKRRVFVTSGRKGGKQRAKNLSPEQRSEAARKAVLCRWAKVSRPTPTEGAPNA